MEYESFVEFVEKDVLPRIVANPKFIRLDGQETGGNRAVAGKFMHIGEQWVVHADTHFIPLILAYAVAKTGADPFTMDKTESQHGRCLVLRGDLQQLHNSPSKHLYIYSWKQTLS